MNCIFVKDENDLVGLKKHQKISFICRSCGKKVERLFTNSRFDSIKRFLCKQCNYEFTCMQRYGCKNAAQNPDVKNKIQTTNLSKYNYDACISSQAI